jgi:hypothetical protein
MRTQKRAVSPPLETDKTLQDFAEVIQGNFRDVFQDVHVHPSKTAAPSATDGQVGDIFMVKVSSTWYLYAKVDNSTWKKVALS